MSDIRGKVGTEIYSRNKGGAYVKTFTSPVQPNTTLQTTARSNFASAVAAWQALSVEERFQWNRLASQYNNSRDSFLKGNPSGYNLFVRREYNRLQFQQSANPPEPALPDTAPSFTVEFISRTPSDVRWEFTFSESSFKNEVEGYYSPLLSPGVTSPNSTRYVWNDLLSKTATNGQSGQRASVMESLWGKAPLEAGDYGILKFQVLQKFTLDPGGSVSQRVYELVGAPLFVPLVIE